MSEHKRSDELSTWQEIADYLGVSKRTAQNWKAEKGLPVRQFPGEKSRATAFKPELDAWKRKSLVLPEPPERPQAPEKSLPTLRWRRPRSRVLLASIILVMVVFAVSSLWLRGIIRPPELLAINPDPVPSLNGEQPLTMTGKRIRPGAKVILLPVGTGTSPLSGLEITATEPTKISVLANLGRGPSRWIVQVINTDGSVSNRLPFSVAPPPSQLPEITGISPYPVVGSNIDQLVTFIGQGFEPGLTMDVRVYDRTYTLSGTQIVSVSPGRVAVLIKVSSRAAEWTAQIQNPTGATSKPFQFNVVAPPPPGPQK